VFCRSMVDERCHVAWIPDKSNGCSWRNWAPRPFADCQIWISASYSHPTARPFRPV